MVWLANAKGLKIAMGTTSWIYIFVRQEELITILFELDVLTIKETHDDIQSFDKSQNRRNKTGQCENDVKTREYEIENII